MSTYLVFAQDSYAEPLSLRGTVEATDAEQAATLALQAFGAAWIELSLVPQDVIFWAQPEAAATAGATS